MSRERNKIAAPDVAAEWNMFGPPVFVVPGRNGPEKARVSRGPTQ